MLLDHLCITSWRARPVSFVSLMSLYESNFLRLKELAGSKMTTKGELVMIARSHRTQDGNRKAARERLMALLQKAHVRPEKRIKTKPGKAAKERRLQSKSVRSDVKRGRGKVAMD